MIAESEIVEALDEFPGSTALWFGSPIPGGFLVRCGSFSIVSTFDTSGEPGVEWSLSIYDVDVWETGVGVEDGPEAWVDGSGPILPTVRYLVDRHREERS